MIGEPESSDGFQFISFRLAVADGIDYAGVELASAERHDDPRPDTQLPLRFGGHLVSESTL